VLAVLQQRFGNNVQLSGRGDKKRNPPIMNPNARKRHKEIAAFAPERHRAAGNDMLSQQYVEPASRMDLLLQPRVEPEILPHAASELPAPSVDKVGVAKNSVDGRTLGRKNRLYPRELLRVPDIILVAQRDDLTATGRNRLLEIGSRSDPLPIDHETDLKRGPLREVLDKINRAIARAIIADDQLIGLPRLLRYALQLLEHILRAIVRAHSNGD
jgi:hypothetical protein